MHTILRLVHEIVNRLTTNLLNPLIHTDETLILFYHIIYICIICIKYCKKIFILV